MAYPSKPALAQVADLAVRLGRSLDDGTPDAARAAALLADASTLVRDETSNDWLDTDGDVTAPDLVVSITLAIAKRGFLNPTGVLGETIGPFSYQRDGTSTAVATADELVQLRRFRTGRPRGLGTIKTYRDSHDVTTVFAAVSGGGDPIPVGDVDDGLENSDPLDVPESGVG